jgi:hypothetical protein
MRFLLPLVALGAIRLRTQHNSRVTSDAEPVEVLTVDATVEHVDYEAMAKHEDLVELTKSEIARFIRHLACNMSAPTPSLEFMQLGRRNATNGTNDTAPGEPAEPVPDDSCPTPAVRLFGNPFHVHAELAPASPDALALLGDGSFPKALSDYLLMVPGVLLYAKSAPICEFALIETKNITSVIPGCEAHLPKLLSEMRHAYTNRMVPWALNAACGAFATTLSFATQYSPTETDKVFCQTASHHLLHLHYEAVGFQHTEGRPEGKDYQDWCVEVCQYRHGETQICARPGNGTNATANGTNATDAAAALVHQISDAGLLRRMRMVHKD